MGGPQKERLGRDLGKGFLTLGINKHQLSQRNLLPGKVKREAAICLELAGYGETGPKGPPCLLRLLFWDSSACPWLLSPVRWGSALRDQGTEAMI